MTCSRFIVLAGLVVLLAACGGGRQPTGIDITRPGVADKDICEDLAVLPQDLIPYAERAGIDTPLLDREKQLAQDAKFNAKFFAAWGMTRPGITAKNVMEAQRNLDPAKGFIENLRPFPPERWQELIDNCSIEKYSMSGPARHGITVENVDVRRMPTNLPFFLDPARPGEGFPFDYFQASSLWMGTPLIITHTSRDGMWVHVETNLTAGWVPSKSVGVVDEAFEKEWREKSLGVIIRDNSPLGALAAVDRVTGHYVRHKVHIGTVLPLAGVPRKSPEVTVLFPIRDESGKALIRTGAVGMWTIAKKPMPITPGNMARVGNSMMGQPYGWGGLFGQRDCSAATRDLFVPFGIWMPRHSRGQNTYGAVLDLKGLSPDEKERRIADEGTPFLSLVAFPGHVALYLGTYPKNGRDVPVMFHNIWGLRTRPAPGSPEGTPDGRAVIGKAVVTTLRPGSEQAVIANPASLLDRVTGLSTMPGRAR